MAGDSAEAPKETSASHDVVLYQAFREDRASMNASPDALELREGEQHVEGEAAHGRRRVELLRDRDERDLLRIEDLDDLREVGERADRAVAPEILNADQVFFSAYGEPWRLGGSVGITLG